MWNVGHSPIIIRTKNLKEEELKEQASLENEYKYNMAKSYYLLFIKRLFQTSLM